MSTPEEVIQSFGDKAKRLKVAILHDEQGDLVLIEGGADELRFLGHLLIALSDGGAPNFHIDPKGAGSAYFARDSPLGLYFHRRS